MDLYNGPSSVKNTVETQGGQRNSVAQQNDYYVTSQQPQQPLSQ